MQEYHDQPQIIDPREIIKEILDLYAAAAEQKNLVFISHLEASSQIYVDPDQLRIILRNLINNAIKFTPKGGEIRIQITPKEHEMMLIIEDTGRGITNIQLSLIQQGELNITHFGTEGEKGMGLGLELCRNYLYQNGGRWEIESEIDRGTRFCLFFPASSKNLVRSS